MKSKDDETGKSKDLKQLVGFRIDTAPEGFVHLANSLEGNDCLEIAKCDIHREEKVRSPNGLEQSVLLVDRQAAVTRRTSIRISREAEFLQGSLLAAFVDSSCADTPERARGLYTQVYLAKSTTTLTCWEDCTYNISLCLAESS